MTDATTPTNLKVSSRITLLSGEVVVKEYRLDVRDPQLDRFALTDDEQHRVEQLLSQALTAWGPEEDDTFAEPLKTLLDVAVEIIGQALVRQVTDNRSREVVTL